MAKIINYIKRNYPFLVDDVQTYGVEEAQKRNADLLPDIQADIIRFAKENHVTIKGVAM